MIGLLQRVSEADVKVDGQTVGEIAAGLLVLIGIERDDTEETAVALLQRLLDYRVFADADGRMNRSLRDTGGGLLLVPQFTLVADTKKGLRPSFTAAAAPAQAQALFACLVERAADMHQPVAAGQFGAHMQVALINDGPVTLTLRCPPVRPA